MGETKKPATGRGLPSGGVRVIKPIIHRPILICFTPFQRTENSPIIIKPRIMPPIPLTGTINFDISVINPITITPNKTAIVLITMVKNLIFVFQTLYQLPVECWACPFSFSFGSII